MSICSVFPCRAVIQSATPVKNDAIFINIGRFAAMLEQAELRGILMGPNGPLMQKERLKPPQKLLF